VIIANPGRESKSRCDWGESGSTTWAGYLKEGMKSLAAHGELTRKSERYSPRFAAEILASREAPQLLDAGARERDRNGSREA